MGLTATCNSGGAGKFNEELRGLLRGSKVVIIAGKDKAGRKHAQQVAQLLYSFALEVKVPELPGQGIKDAADWIAAGRSREELERPAEEAPHWLLLLHHKGRTQSEETCQSSL